MIIARWQIDARFGHKQEVIEHLQRWMQEVGSEVGWGPNNVTMLTGSVGIAESRIEVEHRLKDLGELNAAFDKLAQLDAHKEWSRELEPLIVSGSNRWEVLRIIA
jgi:hypothetical protein